jgi:hypothetical protein
MEPNDPEKIPIWPTDPEELRQWLRTASPSQRREWYNNASKEERDRITYPNETGHDGKAPEGLSIIFGLILLCLLACLPIATCAPSESLCQRVCVPHGGFLATEWYGEPDPFSYCECSDFSKHTIWPWMKPRMWIEDFRKPTEESPLNPVRSFVIDEDGKVVEPSPEDRGEPVPENLFVFRDGKYVGVSPEDRDKLGPVRTWVMRDGKYVEAEPAEGE